MAVSRAPKRTPASVAPNIPEDKVQEIIRRGGSVAADLTPPQNQTSEKIEPNDQALTDELKNVQLRLYESTLQEIDQLRRAHARGRRPISRHSWLLEAIEEKLEKERRKRR
ncbi:hypothetical protein [Deinococcus sp. QL22]|uniref:hypothetical protein n=1 Tax=Deinococcus sp. QL22 TaxID=2939437 RepID=UPI002017F4C6|nr:hypothetical protein [Deinococcus sp. QL22]UQN10768.1 hypothetical protein M1R55_31555 [Deinococcus sp. QL22]UQN10814.1 hypothetical protein M1R55_31305 [Deinococcus sp. QL22]